MVTDSVKEITRIDYIICELKNTKSGLRDVRRNVVTHDPAITFAI